jgi:hypothetical protein
MESVIAALIAVGGVAVGAILQTMLTRISEVRKSREDLRIRAYHDYLQAVSDVATARTAELRKDALSRATFAKTRVALVGSAATIHALSNQARYEVLNSTEAQSAFAELCGSMRADLVGQKSEVNAKEIEAILFGSKTSES